MMNPAPLSSLIARPLPVETLHTFPVECARTGESWGTVQARSWLDAVCIAGTLHEGLFKVRSALKS